MQVIPVIDILNGVAVHAVRGNRRAYQSLKSVLCASAEPLAVASAFFACGFKELYVADLDAIMGTGDNFGVLKRICGKTGLKVMVDAGISDLKRIPEVLQNGVSKVVVGTETLPNLSCVKDAIALFGSRIVVSLDLMNCQVLGKSDQVKSMDPLLLAYELDKLGVGQLIVLDLARVGSREGVDLPFLDRLWGKIKADVVVGGGVRGIQDLLALKQRGVFGVLLATALHSGSISVDALKREKLL